MEPESVVDRVARVWNDDVLPVITDYIRIPNRSPAFDPQWAEHGHMARAVELVRNGLTPLHAPRRPASRRHSARRR